MYIYILYYIDYSTELYYLLIKLDTLHELHSMQSSRLPRCLLRRACVARRVGVHGWSLEKVM